MQNSMPKLITDIIVVRISKQILLIDITKTQTATANCAYE